MGELTVFNFNANERPAYLTALSSGIGNALAIGASGNRISLRGSRFRLIVAGTEEKALDGNYLDVVIVGATSGASRLFYKGKYEQGTKAPPVCFSVDGVLPSTESKEVQATSCSTCPQNEKGSAINGDQKGKACGYFKRMAVSLLDFQRVFKLDVKARSLFGEGIAAHNLFKLGEYGKKLSTRGIDVAHLVTRVSFDTESSVPELYFTPLRYLEPDEVSKVQDLINSDEVKQALEINIGSIDASSEVSAPAPETAEPDPVPEAVAVPIVEPKPVQAATVAPKVVAKPVVVVQAKAGPVVTKSAPVVVTQTVKPAPAVVTAPVQQAPVAATSNDEAAELEALLAQLGD